MEERSFWENWSLLTPGQKLSLIAQALWAMFCAAIGATGDGNTSWRALKTLDQISGSLEKGQRNQEQFIETLVKAADSSKED